MTALEIRSATALKVNRPGSTPPERQIRSASGPDRSAADSVVWLNTVL